LSRSEAFFVTSHEDKLDFTLVAIGVRQSGLATLREFGHCTLIGGEDRHMLGEYVNLVQHPEGDQGCAAREPPVTRLETVPTTWRTPCRVLGSPVFNDQWEVVAYITGASSTRRSGRRTGRRSARNERGHPISAILRELDAAKGGFDATRRALLEACWPAAQEARRCRAAPSQPGDRSKSNAATRP
jgi:endonuclease G